MTLIYAVLTKKYVEKYDLPDAAHRYSPGRVAGVQKDVIKGRPDSDQISTSYVERFNLSRLEISNARMTRLTNGFSRKLENHRAADCALNSLRQLLPPSTNRSG